MEPLAKVYDPRAVEPEVYAQWERAGAFRSKPDGRAHEQTFTIVMPPPNVTGALHLGHALNNTLQDILTRYHRMRGFNTLWQPGTDHAGIATQAVVERRIRETEGKTRHELGREELVRRIWQWKDEYERRIINQLKLMGCSADWERNRFTFDEGMSKAVRHMFFKLFKDGLIFRGKRLVNWDTQLQTAVSDDEVYYETVKGHFWHFKYPVIPSDGATKRRSDEESLPPYQGGTQGGHEPEFVIIATTRPETMLGDTAVAVHPDPEAFLSAEEVKLRESLATAAGKDRAEIEAKLAAIAERRQTHLPQLLQLRDMALAGRKLLLPLVEREIPLIADEWANPMLGSGCVKITPAHDPNDYDVGLRHKLPMINVLTPDGKVARIVEGDGSVNPHSGDYEGLEFSSDGRRKVVADLEARGLIESIEDRDIELGHSDRSKLPIEPFLSDQWFVRTAEPQASACAISPATSEAQASASASARAMSRSPDLSQGATLLTWTTYGTWLPGNERGSVSRAPRDTGRQELRNLPGEPYDGDDPSREANAAERLEGEPVYLNPSHAGVMLKTFAEVCVRHGIEPLALAIMRNHVHVLCQGEQHGRELLQLFKGNASRSLGLQFELRDSPRWWTKSGSRRRIRAGADLTAAIEYVKQQESPLSLWSFDVETSPDAALFTATWADAERSAARDSKTAGVAQAEACGSVGLAQAAMDAVTDGQIQVFPSRYAKTYLDWLGEKRDWCISRQLWWGHRISVWRQRFGEDDGAIQITREIGNAKRPLKTLAIQAPQLDNVQEWNESIRRWTNEGRIAATIQKHDFQLRTAGDVAQSFSVRDPEGHDRDIVEYLHSKGFSEDPDVLDTWFSSALWPFSTLGWPQETPHLKQYYPGSVLCTSRDIITNWVARMVMFGLYAFGRVPFDHVYVHPKILDGRGETMSKSKGNGVDPVDIIQTHGADALRYSMADLTTETQDIRMPVDYLCPHCGKLTDQSIALKAEEQNRKSRGEKLERKLQPADCTKVRCSHKECGKEFATQWAPGDLKEKLSLGRETSEKFELGRNFCNKLWNAARFAFMNLRAAGFSPREDSNAKDTPASARAEARGSLLPEDRWILARLSETVREYHRCLKEYQFAASVKVLREFFWDSLCDWYLELTKPRLAGEGIKGSGDQGVAQQVLAFCIDQCLRLWHPTIPFITEHLWQQLNQIAPRRGMPGLVDLTTDGLLIVAKFPPVEGYPAFDDDTIVTVFGELQDATRGVRELRSGCNVPPKDKVKVTVVVPAKHIESFRAQSHILRHMAGIGELGIVSQGKRPRNAASMTMKGLRVFVHDVSDDEAERGRTKKSIETVEKQIAGKESKLANAQFVANADPVVVTAERERLAELLDQRDTLRAHLAELNE
jgi:valyl-tRNA synthetase